MLRPLYLVLLGLVFTCPGSLHAQIWSRPWGDLENRTHFASTMAFSPDGQWVFTAGILRDAETKKVSGEILAWNVAKPDVTISLRDPQTRYCLYRGHSLAASPDGKTLAVVGFQAIDLIDGRAKKNSVDLWDWPTRKKRATLEGHLAPCFFVVFSGDGNNLVTTDLAGTVISWDPSSAKKRWHWPGLEKEDRGIKNPLVFVWRDQFVVFCGGINCLDFIDNKTGNEVGSYWDAHTGKEYGDFPSQLDYIGCLAWAEKSQILAAGGRSKKDSSGIIQLWDLKFKKEPKPKVVFSAKGFLEGYRDPTFFCSLVFSPDGRYLAGGTEDNCVCLWDVATRRLLTILKHKDQVDRVAFSPDGRLLASLGRDALKMWSVAELLAKKP